MYGWIFLAVTLCVLFFLIVSRRLTITKRNDSLDAIVVSEDKIQATFEHFFEEISTENQRLLDTIAIHKETWEQRYQELAEQLQDMKEAYSQLQSEFAQFAELANNAHRVNDLVDQSLLANDPLNMYERYGPIIKLFQSGKSIEEVAVITGKGTGELQLIRGLYNPRSNENN